MDLFHLSFAFKRVELNIGALSVAFWQNVGLKTDPLKCAEIESEGLALYVSLFAV